MVKPLQVFIGWDKAEIAAYQVCSYSIIKNSSVPVSITPLNIRHFPWFKNTDYKASTEFAFTRFLVPWLCNYKGQAVFMDCDMLVTGDIKDLFDSADKEADVSVVKHHYVPKNKDKFLGQQQTNYEKKNWSSVMVFNNDKCTALSENYVNKASGLALHQFDWAKKIGTLQPTWNYLVGEENTFGEIAHPDLIHFTRGGPYFKKYRNTPFAKLWYEYHAEANSVLDQKVVEGINV